VAWSHPAGPPVEYLRDAQQVLAMTSPTEREVMTAIAKVAAGRTAAIRTATATRPLCPATCTTGEHARAAQRDTSEWCTQPRRMDAVGKLEFEAARAALLSAAITSLEGALPEGTPARRGAGRAPWDVLLPALSVSEVQPAVRAISRGAGGELSATSAGNIAFCSAESSAIAWSPTRSPASSCPGDWIPSKAIAPV
jgi:hypothetical protein